MVDIGARAAWIIDQGTGAEAVGPGIERRGIAEALDWLRTAERRRRP